MLTLSFLHLLLIFEFIVSRTLAQSPGFTPPAWPLAVKNPYLNGWLTRSQGTLTNWPQIWTADFTTAWYCSLFVDGVPYRLMGAQFGGTGAAANQTAVIMTPTRTVFVMQAGPVVVNATFLTPIVATDLLRQSMPFSYFFLTIDSTSSAGHTVRVYSDMTSEWIAANNNAAVANATGITDIEITILSTSLQHPSAFTEISDVAEDATAHFVTENGAGRTIRFQVGNAIDVRNLGTNSSRLQNTIDTDYGERGQYSPQDVFGISIDLGNITSTSSPVTFGLGSTRDPSINFTPATGGAVNRSTFYRSQFTAVRDINKFFMSDFENALSTADALDLRIGQAASAISQNYADLVSLTARQAMSALEITLPQPVNGAWNVNDVQIFMKNMGGVGSGGVNAVDVLYAAFPMYLYLNPAIGGYLIKPLLEVQDSASYTQEYAAQDLGSQFPIAAVRNVQHNFGVEQSANMLIMALAHAQTSGDGSLISAHYTLLKKWCDYLVKTVFAAGGQQTSASDNIVSSGNQTNLILKGIIGIGAMARISSFTSHKDDRSQYQGVAESYMQQWLSSAVSSDQTHLLSEFGQQDSSGLIYNLYADKLLQLNMVPKSVYDMQTAFHKSQLASSVYGLPLDSSNPQLSRVDWTMFIAATMTDQSTRDTLISQTHLYASNNASFGKPFSTIYDPTSSTPKGGSNSPGLGATFSLLALQQPIQNISASTGSSTASKSKKTGALVAGVVGGIIGACILIGATYFLLKRYGILGRRHRHNVVPLDSESEISYHDAEMLTQYSVSPYVTGGSTSYSGSEGVTSSSHEPAGPSNGVQTQYPRSKVLPQAPPGVTSEDWRQEVANLRQEMIERVGALNRSESDDEMSTAPPLYEESSRPGRREQPS